MRITAIETVRVEEHANLLWVLVHTDAGLVGLGETFFLPRTVEAYVHEHLAPRVIGEDPRDVVRLAAKVAVYVGYRSSGAETRGNSAFDIALWDLAGQAIGQPVARLLGGFSRPDIETYNTCAGSGYMKNGRGQTSANYELVDGADGGGAGAREYDDLNGFLHRADELAESLLEDGISAMKIWPFDLAAERTGGRFISTPDLKAALEPFEKVRRAVGDRMRIMVELHSMWQLLPAIEIARALAPYDVAWFEDPIRMDSLADLARFAAAAPAPLCASETLAGRAAYRDLFETGAAGVVCLDLSWCGGLTEARAIASMAEAWHLPVAPHDCTGPVVLAASTHLSLHAPNALVQESVRAFHRTWYGDLVTALPPIERGRITVPEGPGLGLALHPDIDRRFTTVRRTSDEAFT